jgi:hypothetical protein
VSRRGGASEFIFPLKTAADRQTDRQTDRATNIRRPALEPPLLELPPPLARPPPCSCCCCCRCPGLYSEREGETEKKSGKFLLLLLQDVPTKQARRAEAEFSCWLHNSIKRYRVAQSTQTAVCVPKRYALAVFCCSVCVLLSAWAIPCCAPNRGKTAAAGTRKTRIE